jgi:hypothetical protein
MDYSPYDIPFTAEGRRRVHAFSYVREHVRAFQYMGGLAALSQE